MIQKIDKVFYRVSAAVGSLSYVGIVAMTLLNLADVIKMTMRGQTKLNLELTGSEEPLSKVDRMVDRLIFGIIDGALLIGSSMLCTTDMTPKVMGIPALGAAGFLIAFVLAAILLIHIFQKDN